MTVSFESIQQINRSRSQGMVYPSPATLSYLFFIGLCSVFVQKLSLHILDDHLIGCQYNCAYTSIEL